MKKVNYVVPSTEVLPISTSAILRDSGLVDDSKSVDGMEGKAPKRITTMYI